MDDAINLTLALGGYFYFGQLGQWKEYAAILTKGKLTKYRRSLAFGNQSMSGFFDMFRRSWPKSTPLPSPESCGLIPLQPADLTQSSIITELVAE